VTGCQVTGSPHDAALSFVAWSRIFSPLASTEWRDEAWQRLELPGNWADSESAFWSAFQLGFPAPDVTLLLHAALGREGGTVREDWMRVIAHLGLSWGDRSLPPDHLGVACEVLACAIVQEEPVLIRELCKRYLEPWCQAATARLGGRSDGLDRIPVRFAADLRALGSAHS